MSRTRKPQTSADIAAAIRQLEEEKQRAIVAEDQRRGELLRTYLDGNNGDTIRATLGRVVSSRDAHLFGIDRGTQAGAVAAD